MCQKQTSDRREDKVVFTRCRRPLRQVRFAAAAAAVCVGTCLFDVTDWPASWPFAGCTLYLHSYTTASIVGCGYDLLIAESAERYTRGPR